MKMKSAVSVLFLAGAIYDGILGLTFMLVPQQVFDWFGVPPPNHFGYVQFPAALLVVFGLMFVAIAIDPDRNRNLIPYGILLKACYCGVIFPYWLADTIPGMWKPFAVFDLVFLVLFIMAYKALGKTTSDN